MFLGGKGIRTADHVCAFIEKKADDLLVWPFNQSISGTSAARPVLLVVIENKALEGRTRVTQRSYPWLALKSLSTTGPSLGR